MMNNKENHVKCLLLLLTFSLASCSSVMEKPSIDANREIASEIDILKHKDCNLTLITTDEIKSYNSDLIQVFIEKGYRPSPVDESQYASQVQVDELVLEYGIKVNFEDKTCVEKVALVKIESLSPFKKSILSANELKRKTLFGKIKCNSTKALISLTPKCQIK